MTWLASWGGSTEDLPQSPLNGGTGLRRRGGPWQALEDVLTIRQHDSEDDMLLLML